MKPVIDVHTHIFCAKDIPLKGYLISRNDKNKFQKLMIPSVAKCIRKKAELKENVFSKAKCKLLMGILSLFLGKQYVKWGKALSKTVLEITREMIDLYKEDNIDLYVPLMIDYEYWFKNSKDTYIDKQIKNISNNIIIPFKGLIHPFVSFDPARELAFNKGMCNPDGKPEEFGSLKLVKEAILEKGFIGVKLYNSMGYKPFNNASVNEKRKKIANHKKKYVFKGEEYDEVLSKLYDFCVKYDVPITAHCGMYGVESYPDASFDFGQAIFWKEVLEQKKYKNLRLNLAHFGWKKDEGFEGKETWVKDICWMMKAYNNLFADVACHKVVSEKKKILNKFNDYKKICKEFPVVKKRLLFGTDWHVIIKEPGYRKFKEKYIEILKNNGFNNGDIDNFLGGNAMKFLGLYKGGGNYERLKTFYKNNKIDPPEWYKSIG